MKADAGAGGGRANVGPVSVGQVRLVLGVIGHVDHGKSALVRALTGAETDRLVEEKQRGISIALGFAHLQLGAATHLDLIDMPGHERFVRTLISGATGIDAVLLVVAANEGIKPQTVEHINIAALLGLRRAVLAISKIDLVTAAEAAAVAEQTRQLLVRSGLEPLPAVMTSVLQNKGLDELRHTLAAVAASEQPRSAAGLTFLPIDRAFSIAGHGPVVTGTLRGAAVAPGDMLELFPVRRTVRVRAVQVHKESVTSAQPGQRVAVNLRDIEVGELERGMVLAAPEALLPSGWLTIAVRAVDCAAPLKNGVKLRALLGTDELDVVLRLLDRDVLAAGESGFAQLRCSKLVAVPAGEHVILRLLSPSDTVAGGRVLETGTRRLRRNSPPILQRLEDLRSLPPERVIAAEVERAGLAGSTLRQLSQLSSLAVPRIVELLRSQPFLVTQSGLVVRKSDMDGLLARIPPLLEADAAGLPREKLLSVLRGSGGDVLDEALGQLVTRGVIAKRGNQFVIPRPDQDRAEARGEAELASRIAEKLRRAGLTPPNPSEIVTDVRSKRAVDRLLREGVIVHCVDRAKERQMLFHREAIAEAQRLLAPLLEPMPGRGSGGGLLVTEIGAALGISRKYSMPLLDHLDSIRFTRRVKDRRIRA